MSSVSVPAQVATQGLAEMYRMFVAGGIAHGATYLEGQCQKNIKENNTSFLAQTICKVIVAATVLVTSISEPADFAIVSTIYVVPIIANYFIQTSDLPEAVKGISIAISNLIDVSNRIISVVFLSIGAGTVFGPAGALLALLGSAYLAYNELSNRKWENFFSQNPEMNKAIVKAL